MKDFFETEVKINAEAAVAVGDVAGHKVNFDRRSTKMSVFSLFLSVCGMVFFLYFFACESCCQW